MASRKFWTLDGVLPSKVPPWRLDLGQSATPRHLNTNPRSISSVFENAGRRPPAEWYFNQNDSKITFTKSIELPDHNPSKDAQVNNKIAELKTPDADVTDANSVLLTRHLGSDFRTGRLQQFKVALQIDRLTLNLKT
jgi:hypothetical protein